MTKQKEIDEKLAAIEINQSDLEDQLAKRKSAERKLKSIKKKLDTNQERFGDRKQKVRKKTDCRRND